MGLVYLREIGNETKFAIWKIEESPDDLLDFLQLEEHEWETLKNLNKGKRILHWLASRALLRTLIGTKEHIRCVADVHGKPYLPELDYKISLTHSYEYAGAMLNKRGECGIDLELVKEKVFRIKEKFLNPHELEFVLKDPCFIDTLYACWCAKEAIYKLQGKKGVSFLHNITIEPFEYQTQGVLTARLTKENKDIRYQVHYERFKNYMLGYAFE